MVMVVEPGGGAKLGQIPAGKAEANLTQSTYDITLSPEGRAAIQAKATVSGLNAPDYRRSFQQADGAREKYEQGWARAFPGIKVLDLKTSDLNALEKDVELTFSMDAPTWGEREGETLSFTPFGQGASYVESYSPLSARTFDLVLPFPWTNRFTYKIALPAGAKAELPKPVDVRSPFGAVKLAYKLDGASTVVAEGEVMMGTSRVKAGDYPAFRTFMGQIDQALGRRVKVSGAAAGPQTSAR
ncbi:MAG: hypothetical protein QM765_39755 [Myxococcales bacterium]